jgi:hypothetical protein
MDPTKALALALDPSLILVAQGFTPDPWQRDLLFSGDRRILLNCSRGAGKSRTTSALALHTALFTPGALVLLISRAQRQSLELFRYVKQGYGAVGRPIPTVKETETQIEFANGSRIVSLPGKEETIRSFQGVALLVIDEAARVPDDLYYSVRPMLGVSGGRLIALSTPFGQRGFYWQEWVGPEPWKRVLVTWKDCPRLTPAFIESERRSLGDSWVRQEYECSFEAMEGLVYPDFGQAVLEDWTDPAGKPVGGIDFGWRNPFAALRGVLDYDDVLWIGQERYLRETPLHEHASALVRSDGKKVMWYADPAGRTEIEELRAAGLSVRRGDNDIRLGIAAVTARLRTGRLKVHAAACPNLLAESRLYRYPSAQERSLVGENPVDEHNHALAALRYLISRLDYKFIARLRKKAVKEGPIEADALESVAGEPTRVRRQTPYGDFDESAWTPFA